jgi:hypothetical protein
MARYAREANVDMIAKAGAAVGVPILVQSLRRDTAMGSFHAVRSN